MALPQVIVPRDYQEEGTSSIFTFFEQNSTGNPIVAMPTGTGKSVVIALFLMKIFLEYMFTNQRILCLTHVKELIEQNVDKLLRMWPTAPVGIHSAGLGKSDLFHNIIFGGIGSVVRKAAQFGHIDLIIIDEAHLLSPNPNTMYRKFIAELLEINPLLRVVGLTATDYRLGQGRLTNEGGIFTDVCFDICGMDAFNRLIAEYYLCPVIPMRTNTQLKLDGVQMQGGEFIQKQLQQAVDQDQITEDALREAIEKAGNRKKWLIFTTGVEHSEHTAGIAQSLGIKCLAVHSKLHAKERDERLAMLRAGELDAIANNNILTTGFDDPEIDFILVLRPTNSPGLWVQMLGRGTRPLYAPGHDLQTLEGRKAAVEEAGKHDCLVMDYGGNTKRLGPINDPVIPQRKGKKRGPAPVKLCEACGCYNHASVKYCVNCGEEFIYTTKLKAAASTDELLKGELPQVDIFAVEYMTYAKHKKLHAPDSVKVSYYCGFKCFTEYLCFDHTNRARQRALKWWMERSNMPPPESTEMALHYIDKVTSPSHLKVWVNKKYPEILGHCYDKMAFGTLDVPSDVEVDVKVVGLKKPKPDVKVARLKVPDEINPI